MVCPSCHNAIESSFYFCSQCGKQVRDKPLPTSLAKQLQVYFVSFFFPPFGLWKAFRYLTQKGLVSKIVGVIATSITMIVISIITYTVLLLSEVLQQVLPLVELFRGMSG